MAWRRAFSFCVAKFALQPAVRLVSRHLAQHRTQEGWMNFVNRRPAGIREGLMRVPHPVKVTGATA
jgi:hypothetical protein